jgi:hypothetical protein
MFISVNKKTSNHRPVKYAALSSGTISHVWYDDETSAKTAPRRQNRIKLTREMLPALSAKQVEKSFDA